VITVDANGDAIVTSDNAVPTTRTSAVASLPMTTKLFDGWSAVSVGQHGVGHQSPCFCHTGMAS